MKEVRSHQRMPNFLRAGQAADLLGISPKTLQKFYVETHYLNAPRGSRLYSTLYTGALALSIQDTHIRHKREHAREFANTDLAYLLIKSAEKHLDDQLTNASVVRPETDERYIRAHRLAKILGAGAMTVSDWVRKDDFDAIHIGRNQLYLTEQSVQNVLTWSRPESFPDTVPPIFANLLLDHPSEEAHDQIS